MTRAQTGLFDGVTATIPQKINSDRMYGGAAPFERGSDTSEHAAMTLTKERRVTLQTRVFDCIRTRGHRGATDEEIQTDLVLDGNTERPRRRELFLAGVIEKAGTRKTMFGKPATVWIAKAAAA